MYYRAMRWLIFPVLSVLLAVASASLAAAPPKKPAVKPKPAVTVKDLALREAKACDANGDGRIEGPEVMKLRTARATHPKSYLYLFDDNSNGYLDDAEVARIRVPVSAPASKKAPAPKKH